MLNYCLCYFSVYFGYCKVSTIVNKIGRFWRFLPEEWPRKMQVGRSLEDERERQFGGPGKFKTHSQRSVRSFQINKNGSKAICSLTSWQFVNWHFAQLHFAKLQFTKWQFLNGHNFNDNSYTNTLYADNF